MNSAPTPERASERATDPSRRIVLADLLDATVEAGVVSTEGLDEYLRQFGYDADADAQPTGPPDEWTPDQLAAACECIVESGGSSTHLAYLTRQEAAARSMTRRRWKALVKDRMYRRGLGERERTAQEPGGNP